VPPGGYHTYAIRRINIYEDVAGTTPMFLARIVGLF